MIKMDEIVDKDASVDYILEDKNCEVDDYQDLNGEEFSHFVKYLKDLKNRLIH